jgi:rare lipoprotein A
MLRVTNVLNGKQVIVRVNDRGPFRKGRIIDLSWGAAKAIGMIAQGIASVTVERIDEINIPFKPDNLTFPKLELDVADIEEDDSVTVAKWRR